MSTPSGAQKRKKKRAEAEVVKKTVKIESFFRKPIAEDNTSGKELLASSTSLQLKTEFHAEPTPTCSLGVNDELEGGSADAESSESDSSSSSEPEHDKRSTSNPCFERELEIGVTDKQIQWKKNQVIDSSYLTSTCPTDIAHFIQKSLADEDKQFILRYGPNRPKGPFPRDVNGRSFNGFFFTHLPLNQGLFLNERGYVIRKF